MGSQFRSPQGDFQAAHDDRPLPPPPYNAQYPYESHDDFRVEPFLVNLKDVPILCDNLRDTFRDSIKDGRILAVALTCVLSGCAQIVRVLCGEPAHFPPLFLE